MHKSAFGMEVCHSSALRLIAPVPCHRGPQQPSFSVHLNVHVRIRSIRTQNWHIRTPKCNTSHIIHPCSSVRFHPIHLYMAAMDASELSDWRRRHNDVLAQISHNPGGFQTLLRRTRAIIGGSRAVAFFYAHAAFEPSNTDLFVPEPSVDEFVDFFKLEGFVVDSVVTGPNVVPATPAHKQHVATFGAGVSTITCLHRGNDVVNIYSTPGAATEPLTYTWTTLLMSFLIADGACCAYPLLSTIGHGLFHSARIMDPALADGTNLIAINKYTEGRGFEFANHPTGWFTLPQGPAPCDRGWSCPLTVREFGDEGCLNVCFTNHALNAFRSRWVFGGVREDIHDT
ncbi:hypothetical protein C8Q79DRAFT_78239 [Trametes meyenii]|nr:hypothetical protein C8Q79DRAFT_78239 [Trametes meyenii]